jgi:hypothetical protein
MKHSTTAPQKADRPRLAATLRVPRMPVGSRGCTLGRIKSGDLVVGELVFTVRRIRVRDDVGAIERMPIHSESPQLFAATNMGLALLQIDHPLGQSRYI